ncbi:MAG: hypothetical protein R3F50_13100 [Gammaproteobacteria bacterium]
MNARMQELLEKLDRLEEEIRREVREQGEQFQYQLEGTRVRFDQAVKDAHVKVKTGLLTWFRSASIRNVLSAPFIYAMIFPVAALDLAITLYQIVCFRLYQVPRVRRSDYIIIDRHYLSYLNAIEKINCVYCGYANGVLAYAREVTSRTEQYWCPIKHARNLSGAHSRYAKFLDYGDERDIEARVLTLRDEVRSES